jgi:hypothetical protein
VAGSSVFLGLAVEEVEQVKGPDLKLSDQDLQVSTDRPQAHHRLSKISMTQYSMPGRLPLSLFDNIFLFYFFFTLTDSESYTVDAMRFTKAAL